MTTTDEYLWADVSGAFGEDMTDGVVGSLATAWANVTTTTAFDPSVRVYPLPKLVVPLWELLLKTFFYAMSIGGALVGNALVICVVLRDRRMRNTTNYYIVNLAVSDLLVTTCCTWVHLVDSVTEGWVLGAFFCKFNSCSQVLALVSSVLTLTLIACDRFFGVMFAMRAHITVRRAKYSLIGIWALSAAVAAPIAVYREQGTRRWLDHDEIWCNDVMSPAARRYYYTAISIVLFFVPVCVMSSAYCLVIWRLSSSSLPGERVASGVRAHNRTKRKVINMLVIILVVFALCWLPFQVKLLYAEHRNKGASPLPDWYGRFSYFATYLAFANSAFNPMIYTGFNSSFRRGVMTLFCCVPPTHQEANSYTSRRSVCVNHAILRHPSISSSTGVTNLPHAVVYNYSPSHVTNAVTSV